MVVGLSPTFFTLLLASIACCSPVLSGRGGDGRADNSTTVATGTTAGSSPSPTADSTSAAPSASPTVPYASDNPNGILWLPNSNVVPEPQRGSLGAPLLGPQNIPIELQNADTLAPPTTDNGDVGNIKWSMDLSPVSLKTGGWVRVQNVEQLPLATEMAGAQIRLEPGAIRELHWHKYSEWVYLMKGNVQVSAVDQDGKNFFGQVGPGDLWYFPVGVPHSLQATNDSADGAEFLLIFDNGDFVSSSSFSVNWLAHTPKEVIAKNFQMDISEFNNLPSKEIYILPAAPPTTLQAPSDPQGTVPNPLTYPLSQMPATNFSGGSVKIVDSTNFKASVTTAAVEISLEPGAMREMHWHPTQDEWAFFIKGTGRMTVFGAAANARTWDFQPSDVAYIPASYGHYVENIGNTTLVYLEIFRTDVYQDVSLTQWLALSPPAVVQANLGLSAETVAAFSKTKQVIVGGSSGA